GRGEGCDLAVRLVARQAGSPQVDLGVDDLHWTFSLRRLAAMLERFRFGWKRAAGVAAGYPVEAVCGLRVCQGPDDRGLVETDAQWHRSQNLAQRKFTKSRTEKKGSATEGHREELMEETIQLRKFHCDKSPLVMPPARAARRDRPMALCTVNATRAS